MRLLLLAGGSAGDRVVRRFAESGDEVVGVLAESPATSPRTSRVWETAVALGLKAWPAAMVRDSDFAHIVRDQRVDLLLSVFAMEIVCDEVLRAPRLGSYNIHPGPLPQYAGVNPVSWSIYHGERTHGVTAHRMTGEIDGGPIAFEQRFPIPEEASALAVMSRCVQESVVLASRVVDAARTGEIPALEQDRSRRAYFGSQVPNHGCVHWNEAAARIINFVRATDYQPFPSPWGHPRASYRGEPIQILRARPTRQLTAAAPGTIRGPMGTGTWVAARGEWVCVERVKFQGKSVDASKVLLAGDRLEDGS